MLTEVPLFLSADERYAGSTGNSTRTSKYETRRLTSLRRAKGQQPQHLALDDSGNAANISPAGTQICISIVFIDLTYTSQYLLTYRKHSEIFCFIMS